MSPALRRAAYAALFAVLVIAAIRLGGAGTWQFWVFAIAPDLTFVMAGGTGLAKGQINPRAVPYYNIAHSLTGPALLAGAAVALGWTAVWTVGAVAWAAHISADRALGFGPRTREGFQRGPS
jgi:Domain of unknown function (DUF4260)